MKGTMAEIQVLYDKMPQRECFVNCVSFDRSEYNT
jgi:hypothetical protein